MSRGLGLCLCHSSRPLRQARLSEDGVLAAVLPSLLEDLQHPADRIDLGVVALLVFSNVVGAAFSTHAPPPHYRFSHFPIARPRSSRPQGIPARFPTFGRREGDLPPLTSTLPGKDWDPSCLCSSAVSPGRRAAAPRSLAVKAALRLSITSSGSYRSRGWERSRCANRALRRLRGAPAGVSLLSAATIPSGVDRKAPRLNLPCG